MAVSGKQLLARAEDVKWALRRVRQYIYIYTTHPIVGMAIPGLPGFQAI